ncbi:MAG: hypothetical protein ACK58N_04070 [Synechocystis sp.]|jgi:hypothetical protein
MFWKMRRNYHFWLCYLNQPVFNKQSKSLWQLNRFWSSYQIELLEACWQKSPVKQTSR